MRGNGIFVVIGVAILLMFAVDVAVIAFQDKPGERTSAFTITAPGPPTCFEWVASSCKPRKEGAEKPVCTFIAFRPTAQKDAVCLGEGCRGVFAPLDVDIVRLTITGEVATICGDATLAD